MELLGEVGDGGDGSIIGVSTLDITTVSVPKR